MLKIKKTYVIDSKQHPVAVQIDISTFEKIEELLEDYALGQFIKENDPDGYLSATDAKSYYEVIAKGRQ